MKYIFSVIPAYYLQNFFYSSTRPSYLNYAGLGLQIAKGIVKDILSNMNGTNDIFDGIFENSFQWAKGDVVNILARSKCSVDNYIESDVGVSQE